MGPQDLGLARNTEPLFPCIMIILKNIKIKIMEKEVDVINNINIQIGGGAIFSLFFRFYLQSLLRTGPRDLGLARNTEPLFPCSIIMQLILTIIEFPVLNPPSSFLLPPYFSASYLVCTLKQEQM